MFAKINTAGLRGIDGFPVEVEADVRNGIPAFALSGMLSTETREAQSRVWNALRNCSFMPEPKRITINFSPASERKEGTGFDLAIACAVLCAYGAADYRKLQRTAFLGEIGLDGSVKGIRGILSLVFALKEAGCEYAVIPAENAAEGALVPGMQIIPCSSINEVIYIMRGISNGDIADEIYEAEELECFDIERYPDFSEIRGQHYLKRAAEIAVSGMHNFLMAGPAGTGKTMIAKCMPGIMPEITRMEDIEISKVYSICGLLPNDKPLLSKRPFRSPHHGITEAAFTGGGMRVMPGEISLASGGLLFLDEMPLFSKGVLESLRQPLEDHTITVTRMHGNFVFPADFLLVGACNNCACGYYPDLSKCTCTPAQIRYYSGRLSKPLLERIDICAESNPIEAEALIGKRSGDEENSETIRQRVERTFAIQAHRFKNENFCFNSRMGIREIEKYCRLGNQEAAFMKEVYDRKKLSGRTYHKILKVARTIADMREAAEIGIEDLIEAVELRSIEDRMAGGSR